MSIVFLSIMVSLVLAACQTTPGPVPLESVDPVADPGVHHPDPRIDAMLAAIEQRGHEVETLSGTILYRKDEALLNRQEIRTGTFAYRARRDSHPEQLAVLFDQLIVNRVRRQQQREYLFDGTWLTEIDFDRGQVIRRQLAPEGEVVRANGGPIPFLAEQTRADLLGRYTISNYDPTDHEWTQADAGQRGLRLVPLAGTPQAEKTQSVDVVFDDTTLVPISIVETAVNGDLKLVRLKAVQVNPSLSAALKARLDHGVPDPLPDGWKVHVEPLSSKPPPASGDSR